MDLPSLRSALRKTVKYHDTYIPDFIIIYNLTGLSFVVLNPESDILSLGFYLLSKFFLTIPGTGKANLGKTELFATFYIIENIT